MPIRVAIVEDDEVVRESLAVLIGGAEGFSCTGTYASGEKAVEGIPLDVPDVVLMDIRLSRMSGIDCVRRLREVLPSSQIIMLTMFEDDKSVFDSLAAGATGYLLKRPPHVQVLAAIQDVHQGGSPMTSSVARKVLQLARRAKAVPAPAQDGLAHLSPRESEVLALLAKGFRYKEIADSLGINLETVRTHLRRIYQKLQVSSRTEAVVKFLGIALTATLPW